MTRKENYAEEMVVSVFRNVLKPPCEVQVTQKSESRGLEVIGYWDAHSDCVRLEVWGLSKPDKEG